MEKYYHANGRHFKIKTSEQFPVTLYSEFFIDNFPEVNNKRVLDFGTGSGILMVFAALSGASEVIAIDISDDAIDIAKSNLSLNNINQSTVVINGEKSILSRLNRDVDVIVCNPASLPTNEKLSNFCYGGFWGIEMIVQLLNLTVATLSNSGAMYFIHTSLIPYSLTKEHLDIRGLRYECINQKEIAFRPFYSSIMPHIFDLKREFPEIDFIQRDGELFETISLLKVTW